MNLHSQRGDWIHKIQSGHFIPTRAEEYIKNQTGVLKFPICTSAMGYSSNFIHTKPTAIELENVSLNT